ncbi:MAG: type IV pilin N-terminal domain-containing protein [Nitrososphaerota archaeon]|nr:type IV pilin N-terminal domain-containing protein [Nitrososphaerota archaeon]MDG7012786.1 type IV pilin N-terminal domain-containing protein [Nitrososphaerota archaeon]MDG7026692.1 type IV pilin N-terminal domain-containing protein [Nitrososphaerota archaeon]
MKISGRQRKGISPIIATVLIIAATLIAFAAVAGYIFGLFGSSTKSAQAEVTSSNLVASTGVLTLDFSNSGGQSVTISSVSVTVGGTTYTESGTAIAYISPSGAAAINPGVTTTVTVSPASGEWTTSTFTPGTTYTFSLALSNGITSTITVTAS